MRWPSALRSRRLAAVLAPLAEMPEDMIARAASQPPLDIRPVYEMPERYARPPHAEDSEHAIATMFDALVDARPRSTTEALAHLRFAFPKFPLALRLAALVAYLKSPPTTDGASAPLPPTPGTRE